jgi:hypothetical protein
MHLVAERFVFRGLVIGVFLKRESRRTYCHQCSLLTSHLCSVVTRHIYSLCNTSVYSTLPNVHKISKLSLMYEMKLRSAWDDARLVSTFVRFGDNAEGAGFYRLEGSSNGFFAGLFTRICPVLARFLGSLATISPKSSRTSGRRWARAGRTTSASYSGTCWSSPAWPLIDFFPLWVPPWAL